MQHQKKLFEQYPKEKLIQQTLRLKQGLLAANGALCVTTGEFTGRSPEDKFIVMDDISKSSIDWNKFNHPIDEKHFNSLWKKILKYLDNLEELWVRKVHACADSDYRLPITVMTETPWANLFAANLFIENLEEQFENPKDIWRIIHAPGFLAEPSLDGTPNKNFTIISFNHKVILIGGTGYTGEIKKSIFTVLNFILPLERKVLSMHCSANEGEDGETALFFGLSGTGKTTLSADPERKLIGDDEHGWSENGIFNIEGGCYAKIINLSKEDEPAIYQAVKKGALVENILPDNIGELDFTDRSITENTRVSYSLDHISEAKNPSMGKHPKHIFFLSCDAYGVLPPMSKLNEEQALYYFLNGYTAKVAGTEVGISKPVVTFSACFGAPFLPLVPSYYSQLLSEKIKKHRPEIWLINTGWTGGPFGTGHRINIKHTRKMISAILNKNLGEEYWQDPVFNLSIPSSCPGVPTHLLNPKKTWDDELAYEKVAKQLALLFEKNYAKFSCAEDIA